MINRINLILQAKNITAKQFAEEIGIQPSGMSHILSGRNNGIRDSRPSLRSFPFLRIPPLLLPSLILFPNQIPFQNRWKRNARKTAKRKIYKIYKIS